MRKKIKEIVGFNIPDELAEIKSSEIVSLIENKILLELEEYRRAASTINENYCYENAIAIIKRNLE
jgi:hypothetical protein